MSMNNRFWKRALSITICCTLIASLISGCNNSTVDGSGNASASVDTSIIVEEAAKAILEEIDSTDSEESTTVEEVLEESEDIGLSTNWEDYVGDFETFVYGLLVNELKHKYDVFSAYVDLEDGTPVYGIAYTDYSECYSNEEETKTVFKAGFIPYCGETDIPNEEFDDGLQLYDCEFQDESTSFILAYESDSFTEHCVVFEKYLKYGVDDSGHICYETQDYEQEKCDESLGALYSFDEQKYLYDTDFGEYAPISGTSLSTVIDYEAFEKAINDVLDKQDFNFANVDIKTYAYFAQEAIQSYLLSLQVETFLGYDVDYLVQIAGELDPTECYRITSDGLMVADMDEDIANEASALVKWIVGTACVVVTAVGIVGAMVFIECPPLSAAAGAMAGTGIEIFMQVVISGKALDSVEWDRVALAAATGALSGYMGPYVMAQFEGAAYFFVDSALDGLLGGIEKSVAAWLDGESGKQIIKEFGYGVALGFGLSAGFKVAGKIVEKAATSIAPAVKKMGEKVFPNLSKKTSSFAKAFSKKTGSLLYGMKEFADKQPVFHSKYISNKMAWRQINRLLAEDSDELATKSLNAFTNNKELLDVNDNVITKETLRELFDKAQNNEVIAKIKIDDEVVDIVKVNSMVSIVFDKTRYPTVELPNRIVADREDNFEEAAKIYQQLWKDDPSSMPDSIRKVLQEDELELVDITPKKLVDEIQKSDMVLHENADMKTITLVSRALHDKSKEWGGIAHMGGFGLANYLKEHMGAEFFDRFVSAASSAFSSGG